MNKDEPAITPPAADGFDAPGFPKLTVPYPAHNQNSQLHFEGFLPRILAGMSSFHADMVRHHQVEFEQAVIVQCLLQVLMTKGYVNKEELDAVFPNMARAVEEVRAKQITGPRSASLPADTPEPTDLDCSAHHADCHAACCTSFNVFLTSEEAASNKYHWDVALPYRLLVDERGTCVYFDAESLKCTIWHDRPLSCRKFDCRTDGRIWEDYGKRQLSEMMMNSKARIAAARQRAKKAAQEAARAQAELEAAQADQPAR